MSLETGDTLPDITLPASGERELRLTDFIGNKLVIYFYPKDNTPGCAQEGQDFRDRYADFRAAGCEVLGVSRDSVRSHDNFVAKYEFPFPLLSDRNETMCQAFGVIVQKKLYGREYLGIDRSTWLFDDGGTLREVWRKVRVKGHVDSVLEAVQSL